LINPNIFREYDIRGIAEKDLTDETTARVARAFADVVRGRGGRRVILGHDVRESSPRLDAVWAREMAGRGLSVVRLGTVPTPVLYYGVILLEGDAGIMITGSHNPIEYNGFKLQIGRDSLHGEGIADLARRCAAELPGAPGGSAEGKIRETARDGEGKAGREGASPQAAPAIAGRDLDIRDEDIGERYLAMVVERTAPVRPLKIVIDAGNGTAGPVAGPILERLGHHVIPMYCEPDGRFPNHQPDPTVPEYMRDLQARVVAERADLGVGYDGDSDRIGVVDETGRLVYGDQLLALFARDALQRRPGATIVFDVKCSRGLPEDIRAHGGVPLMWRTGHSLTKAKMKEENAPVAGELSGHMFFKDGFFGHDDAIYASARFAAMLARWGRPLSAVLATLPRYINTPEIRVDCSDDAKFRVVREAAAVFARDHEVLTLDGARVEFEDGWGLVRASNTQPVLVLRFEARTEEGIRAIEAAFRSVLSAYSEVRWPAS